MKRISLLFLVLAACQSVPVAKGPLYSEAQIDFAAWRRQPNCCVATGERMAIASGGTYSSKAGREIAEKGGALIDVAVATAFALAVERPFSAGLGGGGFLTLRMRDGTEAFLDFRETAPAKAKRDMYLGPDGKPIPNKSLDGGLAVATPGFVKGLFEAHRKWGKLRWKEVLAPAVRLAESGFPVYRSLAERIRLNAERLAKDAYTASLLQRPNGEWLAEGDTLSQPDLARTLRFIAERGPSGFYRGEVATQIVSVIQKNGGILSLTDLASYRVRHRSPVRAEWKGYTILSAPPPSAGGVALVQMLNVLKEFDLKTEAVSPSGYVHLLSQVMKRAYADRSQFIGDPEFIKADYHRLMSPAYGEAIRKKLDRSKNTPSKEIAPGEYLPTQHGTTHLSVINDHGCAVAMTITINGPWGAALAAPGTGVFLNNEMDDFSIKPGEQNLYGLTGGDANAIAPGKRPVSSMMPTLVLKAGEPVLALGAAGGSRIISSVTQVLLNNLEIFPGDLRRAVFAPRVHHQWLPDRLDLEAGFPEWVRSDLKGKGHEVAPWPWQAQVQAVQRSADGKLTAVFDPRDEGGVEAF